MLRARGRGMMFKKDDGGLRRRWDHFRFQRSGKGNEEKVNGCLVGHHKDDE